MCIDVEGGEPRPDATVVFSHGFTTPGFESRRMFLDMADRLAGRSVPSVLFDYRGSGYSDLRFEEMTLDTELEDLLAVLRYVRGRGAEHVVVWAMSLGTTVAAKAAAVRPGMIDGLVLWGSSVRTFERWTERYGADLAASGGEIFLPTGFKFTTRLLDSVRSYDLETSLSDTSCPLLMVHGTEDDSTDIDLVKAAIAVVGRHIDSIIIEGGNHGFKAQPELFDNAVEQTIGWILAQRSG